jgi:hypothetical protein
MTSSVIHGSTDLSDDVEYDVTAGRGTVTRGSWQWVFSVYRYGPVVDVGPGLSHLIIASLRRWVTANDVPPTREAKV